MHHRRQRVRHRTGAGTRGEKAIDDGVGERASGAPRSPRRTSVRAAGEPGAARRCSQVPTAVDVDLLAGDVARVVGAQERARRGDVVGRAHAAHRSLRRDRVDARQVAPRLGPARHRRVDETGWDRVHRDPVRRRARPRAPS